MRESKSIDLDYVRCIMSGDQKVLVKGNDNEERQIESFNKLLNEDYIIGLEIRHDTLLQRCAFYSRTRVIKVKKAWARIDTWKAIGLDVISMEA